MRVVIFDKNDIDNSGATQTLKLIIRLLVSNGHSISVVVEDKPTKSNYDGQPLIWQHYADKAMNTADLVITQHFPCRVCKKKSKCSFYQLQTRSADEPMTNFWSCLECNSSWCN